MLNPGKGGTMYIDLSTSEACILQSQYVTLYNLISLVKTTLVNLAVASFLSDVSVQ